MKYSEKFWLHFKKKDYKESSNFAAENPKVYHPLGFLLHFLSYCIIFKNQQS